MIHIFIYRTQATFETEQRKMALLTTNQKKKIFKENFRFSFSSSAPYYNLRTL